MPTMRMPDKLPFLNMVRQMPGGTIQLGHMEPHQNIAAAYTSTVMQMPVLAILKWKEDEDLDSLLTRLDRAVMQAMTTKKPVNELGESVAVSVAKLEKARR